PLTARKKSGDIGYFQTAARIDHGLKTAGSFDSLIRHVMRSTHCRKSGGIDYFQFASRIDHGLENGW
ncbi:unnamed protein product, partial [Ilex paraguariensis]